MFHVFSAFRLFWQRLLARLQYRGGAHYLAGAPSLPPGLQSFWRRHACPAQNRRGS